MVVQGKNKLTLIHVYICEGKSGGIARPYTSNLLPHLTYYNFLEECHLGSKRIGIAVVILLLYAFFFFLFVFLIPPFFLFLPLLSIPHVLLIINVIIIIIIVIISIIINTI